MEMNSIWKAFDLMLLTFLISFLVAEYKSTHAETQVTPSNNSAEQMESQKPTNVTISVSVQVNTNASLPCFPYPTKELVMATWTILTRHNTSCIIAYRTDKDKINETNCSGKGISWACAPQQSCVLQLNPVTTDSDGEYTCVAVTVDGNFQRIYHLNVLVPPLVTLSEEGNETVVCKAAAGKPAAQIFWDPQGVCSTVNETHHNRTVTVKSTCSRNIFNESDVTCFIFHLSGNKTLHIKFPPNNFSNDIQLIYPSVIISIVLVIPVIVGLVLCKKHCIFSFCKPPQTETAQVTREDEVEPYASYTEKNNPLYDSREPISKSLQRDDSRLEFQEVGTG